MLQTSVEDLPITEEEFYAVFVKFGIERPPNMGRRIVETMPFLDNLKEQALLKPTEKKKQKKKVTDPFKHSFSRVLGWPPPLVIFRLPLRPQAFQLAP
jgi:hypothetical protein